MTTTARLLETGSYEDPASVLREEAAALLRAADRLDAVAFDAAVRLLTDCKGTVLATGAGTSGTIARKIAATLTSLGTPTLFLHPADALHGGLGNVSDTDVALAVSNSGETDELLGLVPYLRRRGVRLLSILGNPNSTLGRASECVLDASVEQEADPLDLLPTSSTAVALGLGDALAVAVMRRKGVTADAFAWNHPSGRLGRRLTLRVADVMHPCENAAPVSADAPWLEVLSSITSGGLGAVAVVDVEQALLGIITDGDLRRTFQESAGADISSMRASRVMSRDPVTVQPDTLAFDALRLMEDRPSQISVVPVVDERDRYLGMVRVHDLVRAGL